MSQLFKFDSLITPSIVKFVFYFGVLCSVIGALGVLASGMRVMQYQSVLGLAYIVGGIVVIVGGIILSRVATEMILVMFMIRDELAWQRQNIQSTGKPGVVPTAAPGVAS
jgi:cytochrome c biogenesis protein CcdA